MPGVDPKSAADVDKARFVFGLLLYPLSSCVGTVADMAMEKLLTSLVELLERLTNKFHCLRRNELCSNLPRCPIGRSLGSRRSANNPDHRVVDATTDDYREGSDNVKCPLMFGQMVGVREEGILCVGFIHVLRKELRADSIVKPGLWEVRHHITAKATRTQNRQTSTSRN